MVVKLAGCERMLNIFECWTNFEILMTYQVYPRIYNIYSSMHYAETLQCKTHKKAANKYSDLYQAHIKKWTFSGFDLGAAHITSTI